MALHASQLLLDAFPRNLLLLLPAAVMPSSLCQLRCPDARLTSCARLLGPSLQFLAVGAQLQASRTRCRKSCMQRQHEVAHRTLHRLLLARRFSGPAPAKPGMVMVERCLKLTELAVSSRVNERCCSTVLVISPSCVCEVVQRGPLMLPPVLGVAAAVAMSCAAAGCWSPGGSASEAVEDSEGLWLLLHIRSCSA
jgi:hypothetical protein